MSGERCRGAVKNVVPVKAGVLVKTLLCPVTTAAPKVGSIKYFWASSQVTTSRACGSVLQGAWVVSLGRCHGIRLATGAPPINRAGIAGFSQSSVRPEVRFV